MIANLAFLKTNKQYFVIKTSLLLAILTLQFYQPLTAAENSPEWLYSVRPGDTLIHFGNRHLVNPDDWHLLQKLNKIKNPYRIPVGSKVRVPLYLVKQSPAMAEVIFVFGDAYILNSDNSKQSVAVGQKLAVGTQLQTNSKGQVKIRFADGSIVAMQSNATLKLDTLSMYSGGGMVDTKLRLQQGGVEVIANPSHTKGNSMQIFTPSAVAAVRGTDFRVSAESQTIRQETLNGQVALSAAGQEVAVIEGYGSLSENGQAPLPPIKLLPAPDVSKLTTKLQSIPFSFDMPTQKNVAAWVGVLYKDGQNDIVVAENISRSDQLTFNDTQLADGRYMLKVRAKDGVGLEGYDATHQFELKARPFAPLVIYPATSEIIRDSNPVLRWNSVNKIDHYLVEIAQDAEFKQLIISKQVANNQFYIEKPLQTGQYFWRLASIDLVNTEKLDKGPYSATNYFSYKPKPPTPEIGSLVTKIAQNRVYVDTVNPPDGLNYEVALDNGKNNQTNVWQAAGLDGHFNFLLREYGKQTLRLRFVDTDGFAGAEAVVEFDAPPP